MKKRTDLRPESYYHVTRSERTGKFLREGIKGRLELDEKVRVYVWDNVRSARRYARMLKEDYPEASYDILRVRVPKRDPMEPWSTYGLPGARSIETARISRENVRLETRRSR